MIVSRLITKLYVVNSLNTRFFIVKLSNYAVENLRSQASTMQHNNTDKETILKQYYMYKGVCFHTEFCLKPTPDP